MATYASSDPVTVLYDADCGFCQACMDWTRRWARSPRPVFLPLDSPEGRAFFEARNVPSGIDSVIVLETDSVLTKSDAVFALLARCRLPWKLARFGRWIPRRMRDRLYDLVARHRHRFSKRCRIG
jgi:predicted DCC family thiol-disulfide oxidoreductase YuxK